MDSKILVGVATFEGMKYCHDEFFQRIKNLTFSDYDILVVDNSKSKDYFDELNKIDDLKVIHDDTKEEKSIFRLISSRNKILEYGIEKGYTHILMLDSDVIPPINVIGELLKWDKSLVSGLYFNYFNISNERKYLPVAWKMFSLEEFEELKKKYPKFSSVKREELRRHITQKEIDDEELQEVEMLSAGCMLIKREVFKKTKYGKLKKEGTGEDTYFIKKAKEFGFNPYCYTKIKCEHLMKEKYKEDDKGNLIHSSFSDLI